MYTIESRVRYSECDETGKLSLVGVMNYLQDCSTFHSEDIGRGFKQLTSEGYAWVLATWQIQVDRLPQFGEKICVGTWSYQMKGLQASRSFVINDADGATIVKADSTWYLMDINEGKAARVPESENVYITGEPRVDLPPTPRKIALEGNAVDGPANSAPIITLTFRMFKKIEKRTFPSLTRRYPSKIKILRKSCAAATTKGESSVKIEKI